MMRIHSNVAYNNFSFSNADIQYVHTR